MEAVSLLVIGAGPYGVAVAARAIERGIDTVVVGHRMSFWTDHMPAGMFLRSDPEWHLDASGIHTFEAFMEDRGLVASDIDPVPIAVFLDYAEWFETAKHVRVRDRFVSQLHRDDAGFVASLDDGTQLAADRVVAAPGVRYFPQLPIWASTLPCPIGVHTCELVRFEELAGARVLIVGGRQSAYEWAALLGEHGAARVDIVHRHDVPRFERVSWKFVDPYVDATIKQRGWWRSLDAAAQRDIDRKFWEVGRLTLEWWLTARLNHARFHRWPGTHVVDAEVGVRDPGRVTVTLSSGHHLNVDRVVFATGYKANLPAVPYLEGLVGDLDVVEGFPALDEAFQSSLRGLYIPGFASTRDFGPFFGFTKACPAAATLIVDDLLRRA
jgi:cation diffusion facilitator CzcD-associated flavoprotein CzcO